MLVFMNIKLNCRAELRCESRLYLVEEIFKDKVVVVVAGGELHILGSRAFGMNLYLKCQSRMCSKCYSW